jgi:hypothetical protein
MKFPLDINKPGVPIGVLHGYLAFTITECCQGWGVPVPKDLQKFVSKQDQDAWSDWEQALLKAADDMSEELLKRWIDALRGHHFVRAELRGFMMQKFHPAEYAEKYKARETP